MQVHKSVKIMAWSDRGDRANEMELAGKRPDVKQIFHNSDVSTREAVVDEQRQIVMASDDTAAEETTTSEIAVSRIRASSNQAGDGKWARFGRRLDAPLEQKLDLKWTSCASKTDAMSVSSTQSTFESRPAEIGRIGEGSDWRYLLVLSADPPNEEIEQLQPVASTKLVVRAKITSFGRREVISREGGMNPSVRR
ncbi:hypothetical protein BLNAU_3076 [Blattamonas nauphoetae]|uniref:Uncharacterized protein n=1 Tax=Blattamonas nauphoetae TaxID=2049346 RepID=A0ABQ9YE20_9EUKA|nr:hypothetical protein BLNAU_3076 [Blattamonas nauphoetae]